MVAVVFSLVAFMGYACGDVIGVYATRKIGSLSTTFWLVFIRFLFFALYIPFALNQLSHASILDVLLNLFVGLFLVLGILSYMEGFKRGNASVVGVLGPAYAVISVLLSVIFFQERLVLGQVLAIFIIFIGVITCSLDWNSLAKGTVKNLLTDPGAKFGFITMVLWGIYFTFIRIPSIKLGWFWSNYITISLFWIIYVYILVRKEKLFTKLNPKILISLLGVGLLGGIGDFAYNYAVGQGYVSVVAPISGAYPILFVVLAYILYRDKIVLRQWVGIIISLVGIIALGILSRN